MSVKPQIFYPLLFSVALLASGHDDPQATDGQKQEDGSLIKRVASANDAVLMARDDARTLDPSLAFLTRYVWIRERSVFDLKSLSVGVNTISHASLPFRPVPTAGGYLARIYLPQFVPNKDDLVEWLKLWEDFQFDPEFSLLITRDEFNFAQKTIRFPNNLHITAIHENGQLAEYASLKQIEADFDVLRINGLHIDPQAYLELQNLTRSQAPVVSLEYFLFRVLSTLKDKKLYASVFGGRYYEFAGIKKAKDVKGKEKATDLDLFLERHGIGNIKAGLKAKEFFDQLRSDRRAAIFQSGVTGKPRRVDWFHSPDNGDGQGVISVTHDLKNENIDIGQHPIMNLIDIIADAFEAIAEKRNGMHEYAIFDDKESLLDVADATNVVADRTIPAPYTPSLQSAISCMACHEADGSDGWKVVKNDVAKMVGGRTKLDVFTDLSLINRIPQDIIDRAAGLYTGNFNKSFRRARDDYAESILRVTGPWPESKSQTDVVKIGVGRTVQTTRDYWYKQVDAKRALLELGFQAPKGKEIAALMALLPPDPGSQVGSIILEDARIDALKSGISIPRSDWSFVFGFAALRAQKAARLLEQKEDQP